MFIEAGSIVEGARQTRTIKVNIILNEFQSLSVPVFCVEAGRFGKKEGTRKSKYHSSIELKRHLSRKMRDSLRDKRTYYDTNGQHEAWDSVSRTGTRRGAKSETISLSEIYEESEADMKVFLDAISLPTEAVGAVIAIGGKVQSLDVFGDTVLFQEAAGGILYGAAMEALVSESAPVTDLTPQGIIALLAVTEMEEYKSLGYGEDLRFESEHLVGAALIADNRVVCLIDTGMQ